MKPKPIPWIIAILFPLVFMVAGCVGTNGFSKPIVTLMQEEQAFVNDILEATDRKTMIAEACFFRKILGPRIDLFPAYFKESFNEMIGMLQSFDELKPCGIAIIHAVRWQLASAAIQDAIKTYCPDVLRFIPVWLTFL